MIEDETITIVHPIDNFDLNSYMVIMDCKRVNFLDLPMNDAEEYR
jgi:hypothetical protein